MVGDSMVAMGVAVTSAAVSCWRNKYGCLDDRMELSLTIADGS